MALPFVTATDALFELLDGLLVALAPAELVVVDVLLPPAVASPVPAGGLSPGVVVVLFPVVLSGEGADAGVWGAAKNKNKFLSVDLKSSNGKRKKIYNIY